MDIERVSKDRTGIGVALAFILFCTTLYLATIVGPYIWVVLIAD